MSNFLHRLCRQMALFNEAYAAVPLGEDIIKVQL